MMPLAQRSRGEKKEKEAADSVMRHVTDQRMKKKMKKITKNGEGENADLNKD